LRPQNEALVGVALDHGGSAFERKRRRLDHALGQDAHDRLGQVEGGTHEPADVGDDEIEPLRALTLFLASLSRRYGLAAEHN
jgi:hypothetical protein